MKTCSATLLAVLALIASRAWAEAPVPQVSGNSMTWSPVSASTINVHRGDGSYVTSLPGTATRWQAAQPGDYFLVAADDGHWSDWSRSDTVTIASTAPTGAPMPAIADGIFVYWPQVAAKSINVHRGDGTFIETLPGDAVAWLPPALGDYFLVATNEGEWQDWPRSETITVPNPHKVDDAITGLTVNVYSQHAAEVFWDRLPGAGIQYRIQKDGETMATINGTSWFHDGYSPGGTSTVTVTALYPDGEGSNLRMAMVLTPGDALSDTPTINRDTYSAILEEVFGIYFGAPYRTPLKYLSTTVVDVMRAAMEGYFFQTTYSCLDGGTTFFADPFILTFDHCDEGEVILDGSLNIHQTYGDTDRISSSGLRVTYDSGDTLTFSGSLDGALSETPGWYEASGMAVSMTGDESLQLEGGNFNYLFSHLSNGGSSFLSSSTLKGSFSYASDSTGGRTVSVVTPRYFFHGDLLPMKSDWHYYKGVLSVEAEDGSRVMLNANTGDDGTVLIQLGYGDVVEAFETEWGDLCCSAAAL